MAGSSRLDAISRGIIAQLQQDGRRAYASIGRTVGLSEAAVRQRVQRMLDSQLLQIVAVTEPSMLGFSRQALLGINLDGDLEPVLDALEEIDLVESIVVVAGSFDLLVGVVARDDDQLMLLLTRIRDIPGVERSESFVHLKRVKQAYTHLLETAQPGTVHHWPRADVAAGPMGVAER